MVSTHYAASWLPHKAGPLKDGIAPAFGRTGGP